MFCFWPRPAPKFDTGTIASLHDGSYVLIKQRRWIRLNERWKEWAYDVIEIKFDPRTSDLCYASTTHNMPETHIKWKVF